MNAGKRFERRQTFRSGLIEMVIRQLPQADPERPHRLKYRSVYIRNRQRIVGYDNERGKGDHQHLAGREEPSPSSASATCSTMSGPMPGD